MEAINGLLRMVRACAYVCFEQLLTCAIALVLSLAVATQRPAYRARKSVRRSHKG